MEKLEIEVKFHIADIDGMCRKICAMGADSKGRIFESNIRYEDEHHTLVRQKSLLRLRQNENAILTFKSRPRSTSTEFKIFNELEVEVSDFKTMSQILQKLGFRPEQKYEKWRETLILDQTSFFLDTMPYGTFIEIEGQEKDIRHYASRLNLDWHKRILLNYLEIFEIIRKKHNLEFYDLTFKNFENVSVDITGFLGMLEAGRS